MKKIIVVFALMIFSFNNSYSQAKTSSDPLKEEKFNLYHPDSNVVNEFANAIMKAMGQNKHVLLEIGGNWCKWCRIFNKFTTTDREIDSTMNANYVVLHVNYSKENKNLPFLETLEYPQRFGFPVFVVVNSQGQRIHTQNSSYLEDGKTSYDKEKVMDFLKNWSMGALDRKNYEDVK
ncbi:MAG: thioredoxin family protein [Bacteroidota bacterium]